MKARQQSLGAAVQMMWIRSWSPVCERRASAVEGAIALRRAGGRDVGMEELQCARRFGSSYNSATSIHQSERQSENGGAVVVVVVMVRADVLGYSRRRRLCSLGDALDDQAQSGVIIALLSMSNEDVGAEARR